MLNGLNLFEVSQCSLCILAFSLVFTPYLSNTAVSAKSPHYFLTLVALKLLVSLIGRLIACSANSRRQTNKQTHRTTTVTLTAHARQGLIKNILQATSGAGCLPYLKAQELRFTYSRSLASQTYFSAYASASRKRPLTPCLIVISGLGKNQFTCNLRAAAI